MKNFILLSCSLIVIIFSLSNINPAQSKFPPVGRAPGSHTASAFSHIQINDGPGIQCRYAYYYDVNTSTIGRLSWDGGCAGGDLATWSPPVFASGGVEGGNGNFYILDGTSSKLCQFDTSNGNVTILGLITGTAGIPTNGIAYDAVNDSYYLCGYSGSENYLYILDINTLTATYVSTIGSGSGPMIAIAINSSGVGFGYENTPSNSAYTFDPVTGTSTLLGNIGFNAQYGQDMDIDVETGIIYLTAYNLGSNQGELRTMDPVTGMTSLLYVFGDQISVFEFDNLYGVTPVELSSFTGNVESGNVMLKWSTSTETNNKGFEVQKSEIRDQSAHDGTDWKSLGFVNGNGSTTEKHYYSFQDKNIQEGKSHYRLKQIDFDGSYKYSQTVEVNITAPEEFSLQQNYPNPFNPSTNIEYKIPEKEFVTLKVYDVLGNEIKTLVNEEKPAGRYTVNFSASNLASGVYYYRISAGNFTNIKKMILMK